MSPFSSGLASLESVASSVASPSSSSSTVSSPSETRAAGATTLAIIKSLSVIVGITPSATSLMLLKRIESPNSKPVKSTTNNSGIFDAGQDTSTLYLTIFNIPPFLIPGHSSSFSNLTLRYSLGSLPKEDLR